MFPYEVFHSVLHEGSATGAATARPTATRAEIMCVNCILNAGAGSGSILNLLELSEANEASE